MHVVPLVVVLGQLPAGEHACVVVEEVPVAADLRPADGGRAGGAQPVPVVAFLEPAGGHDAVGAEVVPGATVLDPAGGHVAVGTQVVPLVTVLLPARHHRGGVVEEVAASVDGGPAADRATVGSGPVPAAAGVEPAGLGDAVAHEAPRVTRLLPGALAQPVGLGDAGRVGDAEGVHEVRVTQELRVRRGGHEGVLDDDAGHVFLAGLADDRVVVARGAVRVVVVRVVAGLDAAVGQAEGGQLVLDVGGELAALRVGRVVVRGGVAVPNLGSARDGRAGVEVDRHEGVGIGGCGHLDAAGQVVAQVLRRPGVARSGHDDGDAVVGLELLFKGQGDGEGQVFFLQAVGDRARVGTPVPGVDGDDDAGGRLGGRHEGRNGGAECHGEPGCEFPPRGAHSHPSSC